MKEKTEQAVVDMYRQLLTQHLVSKKKRISPKEVMQQVRRKHGFSRSQVYRFVKKLAPDLLRSRN